MLVHQVHSRLLCQFPAFLVIGAFVERPDRTYHLDIRILRLHRTINQQEAFPEKRSDEIFITDTDVLQAERLGMPCLGTELCPRVDTGIAVGVLDKVEHVLHIFIHLLQGNTSLLAPAEGLAGTSRRVLASHARRQHRKGFGPHVLTEPEVLIEAQSHALVIPPQVPHRLAGLQGSHGVLPPVDVV